MQRHQLTRLPADLPGLVVRVAGVLRVRLWWRPRGCSFILVTTVRQCSGRPLGSGLTAGQGHCPQAWVLLLACLHGPSTSPKRRAALRGISAEESRRGAQAPPPSSPAQTHPCCRSQSGTWGLRKASRVTSSTPSAGGAAGARLMPRPQGPGSSL